MLHPVHLKRLDSAHSDLASASLTRLIKSYGL